MNAKVRLGILSLSPVAVIAALAACEDEGPAVTVKPIALTREHRGHFCRMTVVDHKGPKGQIHLKGRKPLFFSSVRDTVAFTMLPEEPKRILAIFVNDMTRTNWDRPGTDTWIDARKAFYVIGSRKRGGMGAPEAVPFLKEKDALDFAARFGGRVVTFDRIPRPYILGRSPSDRTSEE